MTSKLSALVDALVGKPLASHEEEERKIGVAEGVPMLGLDALASSAYGPEAALTLLLPLGVLGVRYLGPILLVILALLVILYFSYRQIIEAYPDGGGAYTVAKENLGVRFGLAAAAALLLDYLLNVAVGISAGVAALISAVPGLQGHVLPLCLGILALIALVNLRGVRESGIAWSIPTYLFIASLGGVLAWGVFKALTSGGHPAPVIPPKALPPVHEAVTLWLLARAFASGCTAMTGVEAVSNGVNAFTEPAAQRAQRTLTVIVGVLAVLLAGIGYLCGAYHIGATLQDHPGYQSVLSQVIGAIIGRGWLYYLTMGSILVVLCLSANTSFAGFPRLCRLIAEDNFLPHGFANRGRRLVYSLGISILAVLAGLLLIGFGGITDRLIPLFAVGAFLAFTLSQAGMVVHWQRARGPRWRWNLAVNALGATATGVALAAVVVAKFVDGAWVTLLLIPALLTLFYRVHRHYRQVQHETECGPFEIGELEPPVVVIPTTGWNTVTSKALRFALRLSPDILAVHIAADDEEAHELRDLWAERVESPITRAGLKAPVLHVIPSPYRHLLGPILRYIRGLEKDFPDRQVAVIIPELVGARWWEYLLHNQRASLLKAALLLWRDPRIVVINVPWYLVEEPAPGPEPAAVPAPRVRQISG